MISVSDQTLELLQRIEARTVESSRDGRANEKIGPFMACAHETSDMVWLSYAVPLSGEKEGADIPGAVARLRAWFAGMRRRLRFEILEPLWPELAPQLIACGVELQGRMPIMLCSAAELMKAAPAPAGLVISELTASAGDDEVREAVRVAYAAFGEKEPTVDDVARRRDALAKGWYRDVVARLDGTVVGVGSITLGNDELVGIGTAEAHRGRGIGAAVSHRLVADHFARGAPLVWLSAGDERARRVYERIGFKMVGDQVNLMDSAGG